MIITIDGPAGSGKSTAARKLAARLEIAYLDTGAMYRALALATINHHVDPSDAETLERLARSIRLDVDCGPTHTRVRLDGHDVSEAIRTMEVSVATSQVARQPKIRALMVEQQRRLGRSLGSFVTEGRDQGSVVFPDADAKFVLQASLDRRAQRRFQEMTADGEDVDLDAVRQSLDRRDAVDLVQWEPLLSSPGVHVLDTTDLSIHDVVEAMLDRLIGQGAVARNAVRALGS